MLKKRLKELLKFARETDLLEVHWEDKNLLINFHRTPGVKTAGTASSASAAANGSKAESIKTAEPLIIRSTMVGTFYRSDSPDRPPFVVEGTVVTSGQPVAAIEAMKIMKDVLSPLSCKIVKALVANGHPVEYGQPLFQVELEGTNV
jgi:biotin carboxyl carrier protein